MKAFEQPFSFMKMPQIIEIPYFQRAYVWKEANWQELLENLLDKNQNHFLGSIILKQQNVGSNEMKRISVVDGQQRLTTLSILLRACYDSLKLDDYESDIANNITSTLISYLFYKESSFSRDYNLKIVHSRIDSENYSEVVRGQYNDPNKLDSIKLDSEITSKQRAIGVKPSSNILQCYKYFMIALQKYDTGTMQYLWDLLTSENNKMLVNIDLQPDENEQAIFDTINSSGVRLTCADTIKNLLFQKALENIRVKSSSQEEKQKIYRFYEEHWEKIFYADEETITYWNTARRIGRISRDNLEILLHCVAVIKEFYDPDQNKMSDLSQVYKKYIKDFDNKELFDFIQTIDDYAIIYRDFFKISENMEYSYSDYCGRLLNIIEKCDVSTFNPYILLLLHEYHTPKNEKVLKQKMLELETYIIRHVICGATTKNYNKECKQLIDGEKSIKDLIYDKRPDVQSKYDISDEKIRSALCEIDNKKATLILFWIELKHRDDSKFKQDVISLRYEYSLEHIIPQSWNTYWPVNNPPVVDVNGKIIADKNIAEGTRQKSVYMIGNMTLLKGRLNTSLRNYEIKRKMEGNGKHKGIEAYSDLIVTRDVIHTYTTEKTWAETQIRNRTKALSDDFLKIWPLP